MTVKDEAALEEKLKRSGRLIFNVSMIVYEDCKRKLYRGLYKKVY